MAVSSARYRWSHAMDRIPTGQVGIRDLVRSFTGMRVPFLPPRLESVRSRVVRATNGRAVGVYEYGDPNGSPLFALHGTPACGAGFDWTDAPAREHGLRVIAPDRPGIGRSTAVPMPAVSAYADELAVLAD